MSWILELPEKNVILEPTTPSLEPQELVVPKRAILELEVYLVPPNLPILV
jgi:hypothetical protein